MHGFKRRPPFKPKVFSEPFCFEFRGVGVEIHVWKAGS